jgi:hypothetical protein
MEISRDFKKKESNAENWQCSKFLGNNAMKMLLTLRKFGN